MSCLADEVVAAWSDGALADHERAAAIEHASACAACRELVGAVFDGESAPLTIGRYEIFGTIGGGGMGVVLRGRDPVLARDVAIKLARSGAGDQAQMLREAQALARLSHPNVVAVHDVGESGGEVFVAMALVDGIPLSRWLAAPRPLADRARVLDGVAAGLAAIHDAGLVHRDIKPDNVVVRANGDAAIVDFGLARPAAPGAAGTGIAGTRDYVAPEVLDGGTATPASDQYAWWILVGDVLAELPPRRRARVDALRTRGTSSDPSARFADMRAAAAALHRALASRWRTPAAITASVAVAATIIAATSQRDASDPCAWSPSAWREQRDAVRRGLITAGTDVERVTAAIDRRATATEQVRHAACALARHEDADDRALGQYRLACVDRTWAEAAGLFGGLASTDRSEVWSTLDSLGLVVDPARCAGSSRASAAPPAADPSGEVTRLGRELVAIARDLAVSPGTRLERMTALGPAILATKHPPLEARWRSLRASELAAIGKLDDSQRELDRGDLAAETAGDDELRTEIAINRLTLAYSAGTRDTAVLEARAAALVGKLDNPVRRAELADTRGMLLVARGDIAGAVASMREAVALYDELSLDASERAVRALMNLGAGLQLAGDLEGSLAVLDRGIAVARRRYGEPSSALWELRGARATSVLAAGHAEEARRELSLVVDGMEKLEERSRALGMAHLMLCQAEIETKATTAVERCRSALASAEADLGKDHPQLVAHVTLYGNALRTNARVEEAVTVLERALAIAKSGTIDASELAFAQGYLALALRDTSPADPRIRALARSATTALASRPDAAALLADLAPLAK